MDKYVVTCDELELPRGTYFTTLPIPVERGGLGLFQVFDHLIAGRWYPNADGADWIQLPGIRIEIGDKAKASFQIVGAVAPIEMTIKPVSNLADCEWERLLENPFPYSLN